jgi:hypothetical protein
MAEEATCARIALTAGGPIARVASGVGSAREPSGNRTRSLRMPTPPAVVGGPTFARTAGRIRAARVAVIDERARSQRWVARLLL